MSYSPFQHRAVLMYSWAGIRPETYCSLCKCKTHVCWKKLHVNFRGGFCLYPMYFYLPLLFIFLNHEHCTIFFFFWINSAVLLCLLFSPIPHKSLRNTFSPVSGSLGSMEQGAFSPRLPHYQASPAQPFTGLSLKFMAPDQKRSLWSWKPGFFSLAVLSG